jgi:predicted Zn-dependent peptidase
LKACVKENIGLILGIALGAMVPNAFALDAAPKTQVFDIAIENANTYSLSLWVPFGSTSDSIPGIAHVLEHLKFKNSDGKGFASFDAIPGSNANAATSYTFTRYDLNVPPAGFVEALKGLARITTPLAITEADVNIEKNVVIQELLERTERDPDTRFTIDFTSELNKGLPFEKTPGGHVEDVASVTLKDVLAFDAAHYQGSRVFLQIAGPYLSNENRQAIQTIFPNAVFGEMLVNRQMRVKHQDEHLMEMPALLPTEVIKAFGADSFERTKTSDRVFVKKFTWAKIITAPTSWRAVAASSVLQDAMRSRLAEGLRDRIADDANLVQDWNVNVTRVYEGVWQIKFTASLQPQVTPAQMTKIIENYLSEFATRGLSLKSFERLKKRNFLFNEWENADSRVQSLGQDIVDFGLKKATSYLDEIRALQQSDVNDLIVELQKPGRVGVSVVTPAGTPQ